MRKESFKKYINTKIKEHTYKELMSIKTESTKMKYVTYNTLKTQAYLISENMSNEVTTDVFKYRTHMLDCHANFKSN